MKINKILAVISALAVLAGAAGTARADTAGLNFDFKANAAAYTSPSGVNGTAGNAASIQNWPGYPDDTGKGLNGAGTTAGDANGPTATGGRTYAFVTGGGTAIYQMVTGAGISGFAPNTTYQLNIDVAGKAGDAAPTFAVKMGDGFAPFWAGADTAATTAGFTHYTYTFTTPSTFTVFPIIQLWNVSTGGETVDFANLSITPVTSLVMNGDFKMNAFGYATVPGDNGGANNPASIPNWIGYPIDGGKGINGAQAPYANIFGPANPIGRTFAFVQNGGNALYQLLTLAPSTTYQLDVDVAGRNGNASTIFAVKMADGFTPFMDSGDLAANQAGFTHYSYVFTTPASFSGVPNVELWNDSPAGDNTVVFANVSIVARPTSSNLIVNGHFAASASAFKAWPGYDGNYGQGAYPTANPEEIPGWINYFFEVYNMGVGQGVNGWLTSLPSSPFGPANPDRHTYAFLQGGGYNLLGQYLPTLAANTTYQLDYDAAARSVDPGSTFAVLVGDDAVTIYNSGNILGDVNQFNHYTATFTTPATLTGVPTIQLWDQVGEVAFANVSLVSLPEQGRTTIFADNFDSADNLNISADIASRQTGIAAPIGYAQQSHGSDLIGISGNILNLARLDNSGADDFNAVLLGANLLPYEVNHNLRLTCDISFSAPSGGWGGVSVRGDATWRGPANFNCFAVLVTPSGGYSVWDGVTPVASGDVPAAATYSVAINVNVNDATVTINGFDIPYYTGYTHTITAASPNNDSWFTLRNGSGDGDVPQTALFDNLVISTLRPPVPTLIHPAYDKVTGNASFQFTSVANGYYVVEYKNNLTDPTWTTFGNVIGVGGLETVTVPSATPTAFFRLRVP